MAAHYGANRVRLRSLERLQLRILKAKNTLQESWQNANPLLLNQKMPEVADFRLERHTRQKSREERLTLGWKTS